MKAYCPHCMEIIAAPNDAVRCPSCRGTHLPGGGWPKDRWLGKQIDGGKYSVERLLGIGGFGTVYEVHHTLVENRVMAMKMLNSFAAGDPRREHQFLEEIKLLMSFDHPYIVKCYEVGRLEDGSLFVLMEKVPGCELTDLIEAPNKVMEPSKVIQMGIQIASALAAAHNAGVLHRDLKPPNVLVLPDGDIRVVDFGIAKILGPNTTGRQLSQVIGTPLFMAPEQFSTGNEVDARLDIYQLGAILHFALTGFPPYLPHANAPNISTLVNLVSQQRDRKGLPGPKPSDVNAKLAIIAQPLDELVSLMLATSRELRPSSAQEVQERLSACSTSLNRERRTYVEDPLPAVVGPPPNRSSDTTLKEVPQKPQPLPVQASVPQRATEDVSAPKKKGLSPKIIGVGLAILTAVLMFLLSFFALVMYGAYGGWEKADPISALSEKQILDQYNKGDNLYYGRGVERDYTKAAEHYAISCDGKDGLGCANLARLYEKGKGVERSLEKARTYYKKGCNRVDGRSCTFLGVMYDKGRGVKANPKQASDYYKKACEAHDARGCSNLGFLYDKGRGVPKKRAKAVKFYNKGCEAGDGAGCTNLGTMYDKGIHVEENPIKALSLYDEACKNGYARGCTYQGFMHRKGRGTALDEEKAVTFYEQGCSGKDGLGCRNLAHVYENGIGGLEVDNAKASEFYAQSCAYNDDKGCEKLNALCTEDNALPGCDEE